MYYNDFLKLLGERIRFIRKTKKIKQEKLAELVNKATEHISFIERGERAPSLELLLDLSQALDVSLPYLLDVTATEENGIESIPAPVPPSSLPPPLEEPIKTVEKLKSEFERMQDAFQTSNRLSWISVWFSSISIFPCTMHIVS